MPLILLSGYSKRTSVVSLQLEESLTAVCQNLTSIYFMKVSWLNPAAGN